MTILIQSVWVLSVCGGYGFAVWGWGNLAVRKTGLAGLPVAWQVAAGLVCLIGIGGVLNLLNLALPPVLAGLLLIGAGLAAIRIYTLGRNRPAGFAASFRWTETLWIAPVMIHTGFLGAYLTPPAVFNYHDDFEKYLVHPLRMFLTGNVAGGVFDAVGAETLGGMAYLQGFVAAFFPGLQVAAVDAVFMSGLFLWMVGSVLARRQVHPALIALAVFTLGAVTPQAVNVTAIYTGAVLLLLAALGPSFIADREWAERFPWFGLALGAGMTLKTSFWPTIGAVVVVYLATILPGDDRKRIIRSFALFSGAALAIVLPWSLNSVPWAFLGSLVETDPPLGLSAPLISLHWLLGENEAVFYGYGETWRHYQVLILSLPILAGWWLYRTSKTATERTGAAWSLSMTIGSALSAAVALSLFSISGLGDSATLRYQMPTLLAGLAVLVVCLLSPVGVRRYSYVGVLLVVVLAASYVSPAWHRMARILDHRSHYAVEAFVETPAYRTHLAEVLSGAYAPVSAAQNAIPAGATVLAMTTRNHQIDFRRNDVKTVNPWFLLVPWLNRPASDDVAGWQAFFKQQKIDFVMLEYRGYAVLTSADYEDALTSDNLQDRLFAIRRYRFGETLMTLAHQGEPVYNDGRVLVARLSR